MNANNAAHAANMENILQNLAAAAGKTIQQDDPTLVLPESNPLTVRAAENRIGIPEKLEVSEAILRLNEYEEDQKQFTQIKEDFDARPEEVYVACQRVLRKTFGTVGKGKKIESFFGSEPPRTKNIVVGLDENGKKVYEMAVPVSSFEFSGLGQGAEINPSIWQHQHYGILGSMIFTVKKKYQAAVEGLIALIKNELESFSIYKNCVLDLSRTNDGSGYELSHRHVKTDKHIVYNPDVEQHLKFEVEGLMKHRETFDSSGNASTFKVCMEGIYGSGKTETAMIMARKATEYGQTAIIVKPDSTDKVADLINAFRIAEMYAPAVLVIEDFDRFFASSNYSTNDEAAISNLFDGADSKTHPVSVLYTTNHIKDIPQVMTRPGRTDMTITFGPLEREPVERMFRSVLAGKLKDDIDFDVIYEEVKDMGPSFVRKTFDKAEKYSVISNNGAVGQLLSTEDLVQAARVMKLQDDRFLSAKKTDRKKVTFDSLFQKTVENATLEQVKNVIKSTTVDLRDGELMLNEEVLASKSSNN